MLKYILSFILILIFNSAQAINYPLSYILETKVRTVDVTWTNSYNPDYKETHEMAVRGVNNVPIIVNLGEPLTIVGANLVVQSARANTNIVVLGMTRVNSPRYSAKTCIFGPNTGIAGTYKNNLSFTLNTQQLTDQASDYGHPSGATGLYEIWIAPNRTKATTCSGAMTNADAGPKSVVGYITAGYTCKSFTRNGKCTAPATIRYDATTPIQIKTTNSGFARCTANSGVNNGWWNWSSNCN